MSTSRLESDALGMMSDLLTTVVTKGSHAKAESQSSTGGDAKAMTRRIVPLSSAKRVGKRARKSTPSKAATPAPKLCPVTRILYPVGKNNSSTATSSFAASL